MGPVARRIPRGVGGQAVPGPPPVVRSYPRGSGGAWLVSSEQRAVSQAGRRPAGGSSRRAGTVPAKIARGAGFDSS